MTGKDIKIVYMGTPDFAVEPLKKLIENDYNIVGVVTAIDKPAGRGQKLRESAVKKYALENNIKILQPEKLKSPEFIEELKSLNAQLQIVVAFRMLPEIVWAMPSLGTFNLHASLLPNYRGAAPINWAVINGEKETGITTFIIEKEIDTGNIILQEKVQIDDSDNAGIVHDKLMLSGAELVAKTVNHIATENYELTKQSDIDLSEIKPAPKIFKDDCKIDWEKDTVTIHNLIRGMSPYPAAFFNLQTNGITNSIKVFSAEKSIAHHSDKAGQIITDNKTYFKIATKDGYLKIKDLQLSGKKRMKTEDFLRGYKITKNAIAV